MVVGIALSGAPGWGYPTSLSVMAGYQILTLVVTEAYGFTSSPHLLYTAAVTSSALFLPYLPLLFWKWYAIWMKKCSVAVSELPFFSRNPVLGIKTHLSSARTKSPIAHQGEVITVLVRLPLTLTIWSHLTILERNPVSFKKIFKGSRLIVKEELFSTERKIIILLVILLCVRKAGKIWLWHHELTNPRMILLNAIKNSW